MESEKPPCPQHGVRGMRKTYTNGSGSWFRCSYCDFHRWVEKMEVEALVIRALLVFCAVFGAMNLLVH